MRGEEGGVGSEIIGRSGVGVGAWRCGGRCRGIGGGGSGWGGLRLTAGRGGFGGGRCLGIEKWAVLGRRAGVLGEAGRGCVNAATGRASDESLEVEG